MAPMIEMELKALLKNKSQVIQKLENFGCEWIFVGLQEDTIYEKKNINQIVDTPVFRIRRCKDKKILTLKVLKEDFNTAEELELNISDEKIMDKILQTIDFLPKIQIKKKERRTNPLYINFRRKEKPQNIKGLTFVLMRLLD